MFVAETTAAVPPPEETTQISGSQLVHVQFRFSSTYVLCLPSEFRPRFYVFFYFQQYRSTILLPGCFDVIGVSGAQQILFYYTPCFSILPLCRRFLIFTCSHFVCLWPRRLQIFVNLLSIRTLVYNNNDLCFLLKVQMKHMVY